MQRTPRHRIAAALTLAAALFALAACNTVEGIGKDIQKAGQAIEGAGQKGKK
ncbi:entericidin A/B family lipoprotein [Rhodospirillum centenum]|uniref:Conserved domain protein n=1 Tax=Rhodospirillum centenum (strain ATCC 51521 / SW) TaxID=414684 RepID=B6IRB8_RHOCS|nr:entericidin A/B family lipoprotein [Rhodospirillum centenum]ACI98004.1 conserved domain protein [Rhodospirillum centenum SW]